MLLKEKVSNPFNLSVTLIGKVKMALVPTSDVGHGVTPPDALSFYSFFFLHITFKMYQEATYSVHQIIGRLKVARGKVS